MACEGRGCEGQDICNAVSLCCIQFRQGCSTECNSLPAGYARLGVTPGGGLQICRFIGGQCQCAEITPQGPSVFTDNANTSTFTHTSGTGQIVTIDVCQKIQFCTIGRLQNVSALADTPTPIAGQTTVLAWNGTQWEPQNIAPGVANQVDTFSVNGPVLTHTSVNGTTVNVDICQIVTADCPQDAFLDIPNTSLIRHTNIRGIEVTVDLCAKIAFCTIGRLQNVAPGADTPTNGQALVWNATTNLWEPRGPDFITDEAGTDRFTHTGVNGATQVIALCNKIRFCTIGTLQNVDPTADAPTEGQVLTWNATTGRWEPRALPAQGGNFTNPAGTTNLVHTNSDGTTIQTVNICPMIDLCPRTRVFSRQTTPINIPDGGDVVIPYNDEQFDSLNEFNPATGIFTPTVTGYYNVCASAILDVPPTAGAIILNRIDLNGVELGDVWTKAQANVVVAQPNVQQEQGCFMMRLNAGDQLRLRITGLTGTGQPMTVRDNINGAPVIDNWIQITRLTGPQ